MEKIMYSKMRFARAVAFAVFLLSGVALSAGGALAQQATATPNPARVQRSADRALARDIRKALDHQQGLDVDDVRIIAKHGVIGLDGTVPDSNQQQKVSAIVAGVPGVKSVRSYLTVREEGN
jgi:hyperosmotically inducible periplasmic protein